MSALATRTSTVSICGDGLRERRLVADPLGEQRGNAAGGDRNDKNNNTRGFHTLHFPHDAATLPPL